MSAGCGAGGAVTTVTAASVVLHVDNHDSKGIEALLASARAPWDLCDLVECALEIVRLRIVRDDWSGDREVVLVAAWADEGLRRIDHHEPHGEGLAGCSVDGQVA